MKSFLISLFFLFLFSSTAFATLYDPYTGKPVSHSQTQPAVTAPTSSVQLTWTEAAQQYGPLIVIGAVLLTFLLYGFHLIHTAMNRELIFYYNFLDFSTNIAAIIVLAIVLWKWPYRYIVYLNGTKSYDPSYLFLVFGTISFVVIYNLCMGIFMNYRYCHIVTGFFVGIYRTVFFVALPIALLFCIKTADRKEFYGRPGEEHDPAKYRSVIDTALTVIAMGVIFYTVSKLCNGRQVQEKYAHLGNKRI